MTCRSGSHRRRCLMTTDVTDDVEECGFCRTPWVSNFGCTYLMCPNYGIEEDDDDDISEAAQPGP